MEKRVERGEKRSAARHKISVGNRAFALNELNVSSDAL